MHIPALKADSVTLAMQRVVPAIMEFRFGLSAPVNMTADAMQAMVARARHTSAVFGKRFIRFMVSPYILFESLSSGGSVDLL